MKDFVIGVERTIDALLTLEPEWCALEPQMPQLPFVTFDWVAAWWIHMRSRRAAVKDDLFAVTFRDAEGRLVGVAPLMVTTCPNAGPLSIRQLQFIGADRNMTELRCLAAPVSKVEAIYAELVTYLRSAPVAYDWLKLTGIEQRTSTLDRIRETFGEFGW